MPGGTDEQVAASDPTRGAGQSGRSTVDYLLIMWARKHLIAQHQDGGRCEDCITDGCPMLSAALRIPAW